MPRKGLLVAGLLILLTMGWALLRVFVVHGGDALEIAFLSVGQGDCAFLRTPSGRTMLIDGGTDGGSDVGYNVIAPFLRRKGVNRIDVLVLSHPHADHLSGLVAVVREFRVGMVLDPCIPHPSPLYSEFLQVVKDRGALYRQAVRGQTLDLGDGAKAEVLNPPSQRLSGTQDDVNNGSVVLRFSSQGHRILFAGDAEYDAEMDIMRSGMNVKCDVLKIGHHGGNDATSADWLDAARPKIAVISVGRSNSFGHPQREVLSRLEARGVRIYRTDHHGAVTVRFVGGAMTVRTTLSRAGF